MRSRKALPYLLFFVLAVTLSYGSDIAPYYVSLFSGKSLKTIGPLWKFEEACEEPPRQDMTCRTAYRIPEALLRDSEGKVLGLGIILRTTRVQCASDRTRSVDVLPANGGTTISDFNTYRTIDLASLQCTGDLLITNWANSSFRRYGYTQGPAVIGSAASVDRVKRLAELFQGPLGLLLCGVFFTLFVARHTLGRALDSRPAKLIFDHYVWFWIGFILMIHGGLTENLLPVEIGGTVIPRISNFFSFVAFMGPSLTFIARTSGAPWLRRLAEGTIRDRIRGISHTSLLVLFAAVLELSPFFSWGFIYAFLFLAIVLLFVAIENRNALFLLMAVCLLSDTLTMLMVPYLPASRIIMVYVALVYISQLFRQIREMETLARAEGASQAARQVAHDIRSPLAALQAVQGSLPEVSASQRELLQNAIGRIQAIADRLRANRPPVNNEKQPIELNRSNRRLKPHRLAPLAEALVSEKRLQYRHRPEVQIETIIEPSAETAQAPIDPIEFQRALSNLINNSVEAIDTSGTVTVQISVMSDLVCVSVMDSGKGMSPHVLSQVGTRGRTEGKPGGQGLGLYHAKVQTEAWGGRLRIESEINRGTRVTIELPRSFDRISPEE